MKNRGDRDGRREKRVVGNKMRVWLEGQQKSDGKETKGKVWIMERERVM